jgi:hypothetical protein
LEVLGVEENGPAAGKLRPGDTIAQAEGLSLNVMQERYAVDSKTYDRGPMGHLAEIVDLVEATDAVLGLQVLRAGKTVPIQIQLSQIGSLGLTYPFACKKSDLIYDRACDRLLKMLAEPSRKEANGLWAPVGKAHGEIANALGGLALLSHPNKEKYRPAVAAMIEVYLANHRQAKGRQQSTHVECISRGHLLLFFSEYYLATKDPRVADMLEYMYKQSLAGQMPYGGWGHKLNDGTYGGSGFGIATAHMMMGLGMASKCIKLDPRRTRHSLDHLNVISSDGQVNYAGSFRGPDKTARQTRDLVQGHYQHSGNDTLKIIPGGEGVARTGASALALILLQQDPNRQLPSYTAYLGEPRTYFRYQYPHATHVMGLIWCTLASANLDPVAARAYLDYARPAFTMGRRYDARLALPSKRGPNGLMVKEPDKPYGDGVYAHAGMALLFGMGKGKLELYRGIRPILDVDKYADELAPYKEWNRYYFSADLNQKRQAPGLVYSGNKSPLKPHQVNWHFGNSFSYTRTVMRDVDMAWAVKGSPSKTVEGEIVTLRPQVLDLKTKTGDVYHFLYQRGSSAKVTGTVIDSDDKNRQASLASDPRAFKKIAKADKRKLAAGQKVRITYGVHPKREEKSATIGIWGAAETIEVLGE